jgi:diguanylate cyclase (GGDEF)-like protein
MPLSTSPQRLLAVPIAAPTAEPAAASSVAMPIREGAAEPAGAEGHSDDTHPQALAAENALLRIAMEQMPHGLCMFDGHDRLLLANRHYAELWGLPAELIRPGTLFADVMAATRGTETPSSRAQPVAPPGVAGVRRREWRMDDGRTIEVVVTRLADGTAIALHEDITDQRRAEARISFLARHDALTGLANRATLREELERLLVRNARGEALAALCLDLDRFKAVNDSFGHPAGDQLLRQVAERLRQCARETDLVVRLGGDEFAILQCGSPQPASSTTLARRLISALTQPFVIDGQQVSVGTSVGIAVAPFDGDDPDALLRNADLALYRAKADGRGTLRYFEPEMDARMRYRRLLESDLRQAVECGQFELAYQPQVDVGQRRVTGVEALLRWPHPERGNVPPDDFIALAEETGLIVPIGRWVLARACRDALDWPPEVRVAVNVSAVQFAKGTLLGDVGDALAASGLPPGRLELEVTESVLLHDPAQALALLNELQRIGVRVAMDDFGTGYSSLSTLRSFPFDRIKIDRSFVDGIDHKPDALSIIRAMTGLGHSLGMATTVEGVETAAQFRIVRDEGCAEVQGFLLSRPRPAAELPDLIRSLAGRDPAVPLEETSA